MQNRRLIDQTETVSSLRRILEIKILSSIKKISEEDKAKIKKSILSIQYSNLVHHGLHFISAETARALVQCSHLMLQEWGNKCINFYTTKNKFVKQETGLVITPEVCTEHGVGASTSSGWKFQGFWRLETNAWHETNCPESINNVTHDPFLRSIVHLQRQYSIDPPQCPLISPVHVAAMIGDIDLMQALIKKGKAMRLEEDLNEWKMTPLEMAVKFEQLDMVDFLLKNNATKNLDRILKHVIEKGSFKLMEKFIDNPIPFTDEMIEIARHRDRDLCQYLETRRKSDLAKSASANPLTALKTILNYPKPSLSLIVDLILDYPDVITKVENEATGGTILHWTIANKDLNSIQALMEAIYEAKLRAPGLTFDIESKNKQNKTVLDLVLAKNNPEITSVILLYGDPKTSDAQKTQIINGRIDLAAIGQKRNALTQHIICNLHQRLDLQSQIQIEMLQDQIKMKREIMELVNQSQVFNQVLMQVCSMLNLGRVEEPLNNVDNQRLLLEQQANNPSRFFAFLSRGDLQPEVRQQITYTSPDLT
jgi:ankyrin repeat protein